MPTLSFGKFALGIIGAVALVSATTQNAPAATAEIFIPVECMHSSDPKWALPNECPMPRGRIPTFKTAEECENFAGRVTRGNPPRPGDTYQFTWKCFKKTISVWEPVK
jgi:hypothetical protein